MEQYSYSSKGILFLTVSELSQTITKFKGKIKGLLCTKGLRNFTTIKGSWKYFEDTENRNYAQLRGTYGIKEVIVSREITETDRNIVLWNYEYHYNY